MNNVNYPVFVWRSLSGSNKESIPHIRSPSQYDLCPALSKSPRFVLCRGAIVLVLHFEHDGYDFDARVIRIAKDVAAFTARSSSLSFSKYAFGNAVARSRSNSVSQCCSRVSPIILVDSRAFRSRSRSDHTITIFDLCLVLIFERFLCKELSSAAISTMFLTRRAAFRLG